MVASSLEAGFLRQRTASVGFGTVLDMGYECRLK